MKEYPTNMPLWWPQHGDFVSSCTHFTGRLPVFRSAPTPLPHRGRFQVAAPLHGDAFPDTYAPIIPPESQGISPVGIKKKIFIGKMAHISPEYFTFAQLLNKRNYSH
ncbi:MAG: hypothetical protein LBJ01_04260 [Tannerella sp.]|nr:hypothetical protein [Tannerella sp.]